MANDVVVGTYNTHSWERIDIPTDDIVPIHTSLENDFGWTSFGENGGKVFYNVPDGTGALPQEGIIMRALSMLRM